MSEATGVMPEGWGEAQEVQSNWFKFLEVGDHLKGTLLSKKYKVSEGDNYPPQWVYQLRKEDGTLWNVGISEKKAGTIDRLNSCKMGEIVGIVFEKEGEAKKGLNPAKYLKIVTFGMDENYDPMEGGAPVTPVEDMDL